MPPKNQPTPLQDPIESPKAPTRTRALRVENPKDPNPTYSLHCSSFLGLPYRILIIFLVKPKKGTAMETIGKPQNERLRVEILRHRHHKPNPKPETLTIQRL